MPKNLTPRSITALAVVALSFTLLVCIARYGGAVFAETRALGFAANVAGWFVEVFGAGAFVLVVLPLIWGVIVYFDERTPDLLLRLAGTMVLMVTAATLVALCIPAGGNALWGGNIGTAVAGALGGGVIAWALTLALFIASFVFATDWGFHTLRRAGRTRAADEMRIATEPALVELREEADEVFAREFVEETPRAVVAASEMEARVRPVTSVVEVHAPDGWAADELESGRTVLKSPTGYRGVEFLPPSDELASAESDRFARPEPAVAATVTATVTERPDPIFQDEEFVATESVAYFVQMANSSPSYEDGDDVEAAESEAPTAEIDFAPAETQPDPLTDAVEALFAAVTTRKEAPVAPAEPAAASGIGIPSDSPFLDEFFPTDAGWPYAGQSATGASDGASAANEMAASYGAQPKAPAPLAAEPVPAPAPVAASRTLPADTEPAFEPEWVAVDDVVSRLPAQDFDDSIPTYDDVVSYDAIHPVTGDAAPSVAPVADGSPAAREVDASVREVPAVVVRAVAAHVEPEPQLTLFSEPFTAHSASAAGGVATAPAVVAVDLTRLHAMELDPMFGDAVSAILERGRASAVVLQRQLGIGYARGIRILEQMTAAGLVGPDTPTGSREIRVTRDAWQSFSR